MPAMPSKVLIVEDDDSTRSGLQELLKLAGYDTFAASTLQEGMRLLTSEAPDLLIADVRLGEFNGLQLAIESPRPIPTIIVTGFSDPVLEAEARRLGASYLIKPLSPPALIALIKEKLESVAGQQTFSTARRWTRKPVVGELPAQVKKSPARILDISYGGLRLEIEGSFRGGPPASFSVTLPASRLSIPVELVWKSRSGDQRWLCGAAISQANQEAARAWVGLVDAIS
jgi:DNA-binding response OmpR family regulator